MRGTTSLTWNSPAVNNLTRLGKLGSPLLMRDSAYRASVTKHRDWGAAMQRLGGNAHGSIAASGEQTCREFNWRTANIEPRQYGDVLMT